MVVEKRNRKVKETRGNGTSSVGCVSTTEGSVPLGLCPPVGIVVFFFSSEKR